VLQSEPDNAREPILVLVVDNDPDFRNTMVSVLSDCGFRVATATNGLQALHAVASLHPSVVLLDMQMPVLNGIGFAHRLAESGEKVGIIVMSGHPISAEELEEMGALAYVPKPFDLDELCQRIEKATGGRAA
jgi:CheY-like chemotaxis protein